MEPFDRYGGRSDTSSHSRAHNLDGIHAQQKLPSFRDIIPAHLHDAIDSNPQTSSSDLQSTDSVTLNVHAAPSISRSLAPSPVQSQTGSMPSMNEGFEEFGGRGAEGLYTSHHQGRRMSDHATSWAGSSQYPEIATAVMVAQPLNYQHQPFAPPRTSPSLPPIRDGHTRTDRMHNGYEQPYAISTAHYPAIYAHTPITDFESVHVGARRTHHLDPAQRSHLQYSTMNRHYNSGTPDYSRYGQPSYDPYRGNTPYQASYTELDYSPHNMNGSQHTGFALPGEHMDSRNKRRRGNLPKPVTDLLKEWLHQHVDHPYPSEEDKQYFIQRTGLTISQISNWFINARRRQVPSIKSSRERSTHGGHIDHRAAEHLRSHDPSLSPR